MIYKSMLGMDVIKKVDANLSLYSDLNLNQIIQKITEGKYSKILSELYYSPLKNVETIQYRQDIFKDLYHQELYEGIEGFKTAYELLQDNMVFLNKIKNKSQKESYYLSCVCYFCSIVEKLWKALEQAPLQSDGFLAMKSQLKEYLSSNEYKEMEQTANTLQQELQNTRFYMKLTNNGIYIDKCRDEVNISDRLEELLCRFWETHNMTNHCRKRADQTFHMNSLEEKILEAEKNTTPAIFHSISIFMEQWGDFLPDFLNIFSKEIMFYISYLDFIHPLMKKEYSFGFPTFTTEPQTCCIKNGFDLLLADKHVHDDDKVVLNSIKSDEKGFIFVVTGPNQGGKTTFARMLGQINYLALLGIPVPASTACLHPRDNIFTHFEQEEIAYSDNGKLKDDLKRIHDYLAAATEHSMIIMNEMLSSTTYQDAIELGKKIIHTIEERKILCIYVSFVKELSNLGGKVVSLESVVDLEEYGRRTYRILPKTADGNAYAKTIADKYSLSFEKIIEKINQNKEQKP